MLYNDQRVAGFFKDGHELKDCEGSEDLHVLEPAVQSAEDGRVVATDVEHFVTLKILVAV